MKWSWTSDLSLNQRSFPFVFSSFESLESLGQEVTVRLCMCHHYNIGAHRLCSARTKHTNRMDLCQSIESEIGHWCMCSVCRTTSAMKLKTTAVAVSCGDHTLELFGETKKVHRIDNDRVVRVPAPTTCGRRQRGSYLILNVCAVCVCVSPSVVDTYCRSMYPRHGPRKNSIRVGFCVAVTFYCFIYGLLPPERWTLPFTITIMRNFTVVDDGGDWAVFGFHSLVLTYGSQLKLIAPCAPTHRPYNYICIQNVQFIHILRSFRIAPRCRHRLRHNFFHFMQSIAVYPENSVDFRRNRMRATVRVWNYAMCAPSRARVIF